MTKHALAREEQEVPVFDCEPLHAEFGARVTGLDMSVPLSEDVMEELRTAIDTYSFLVFPSQHFDDEKQLRFTRQLGEPEPSHTAVGRTEYFGTIGNVQQDGTALGNSDKKTIFLTGNNMWHSDASFKEVPAYVSIMCAYETPDRGGATLFVSTRSAYERLSDEDKKLVDPLIVIHDYVYSRSKVAPDAVSPALAASLPPVRQRLVRTNPRNGAKNFFIGSHAKAIEGWADADSRRLLDRLLEEAIGGPHIYSHRWQPGDLAIWDNRCLLHRGEGYDADRYRRYMRQTRVRGVETTLAEVA